jgi:hypothetical protein
MLIWFATVVGLNGANGSAASLVAGATDIAPELARRPHLPHLVGIALVRLDRQRHAIKHPVEPCLTVFRFKTRISMV